MSVYKDIRHRIIDKGEINLKVHQEGEDNTNHNTSVYRIKN